jgi:hypothetical protein
MSNESLNEVAVANNATFQNLSCHVTTNTGSECFLKFRDGGADGNQSVTITSSTTGVFTDTTNSDAVTQADLISFKLDEVSAGMNIIVVGLGYEHTGSTLIQGGYASNTTTSDADLYCNLFGIFPNTTESFQQTPMPSDMTLENTHLVMKTNSRGADVPFTIRIDGVNGNQTMTITASTTGTFADTTNSDSVNQGDLVNYYMDLDVADSGIMTIQALSIERTDATPNGFCGTAYTATPQTSTTTYINPSMIAANTDETTNQAPIPEDMTLGNFYVNITANTRNASTDCKTRIDGVDGNSINTISSSTTGVFGDTSNTDVVSQGDKFCYMTEITSGSGTINMRATSIERTV